MTAKRPSVLLVIAAVSIAMAGCKWQRAYYVPYAGKRAVAPACVDRCNAKEGWEHYECLKRCPGVQVRKRCPADLRPEDGYCAERLEFSSKKTKAFFPAILTLFAIGVAVNALSE